MTENIALDYIKRRMRELGYGDDYHMQLRHIILQSKEDLKINAYNSYFILAEEPRNIHVHSQSAVFDLKLTNINELQYEFHGPMVISNTGTTIERVRFIQVTPFKKD